MVTLTTYNKTGLRRIAELRAELLAISNASVRAKANAARHCPACHQTECVCIPIGDEQLTTYWYPSP